ncbi:MAG: YgcG family protein [Rhodocyclaceae bacterium]|nr:MAG: YgcG family protein [Rhodocyclaceae bacterium]
MGGTALADDGVAIPPLSSRVTDLTGTLDAGQKAQLETALQQIEAAKGAQIGILLLPSVKPETIEQYGIRLAEAWKLGRKGVDDGLIIIVAKADRRMRIEVGYGLEGNIPDAVAKRIVSEEMAPRFKQGDYFGGLQAAVQALSARIGDSGGAPPTDAGQAEQDDGASWFSDHATLLFFFIFGAGVLHALLGVMGYVVVAGIAGVIAFLATASWLIALGAAVAVFLLSLLGLGRMGGGGFSSGGGWGSSSDGGFSGGGGGFGGGGASGDW